MQNVVMHWWVFMAAVVLPSPAGSVPTLTLHRAFPVDKQVNMSQLVRRDRARHSRLLPALDGLVWLPVHGSHDPYIAGLYFTTVNIGTPAQKFYVKIDTGSDGLWVSCSSCSDCPTTRLLGFVPNFFNASSSSTAQAVSCSVQKCKLGTQSSSHSLCDSSDRCSYKFQYWNGTGTSGHYLSDVMHLNLNVGSGNNVTTNTSNIAPIVFGCSTIQTGDLTKDDYTVLDGIIGFGQQSISVISQLSSQGITPRAFSHCLIGDSNGGPNLGFGGTLAFGEIIVPGIVYTPLVPNQPHYMLYMRSISVNGHLLPIRSSTFTPSSNTSGTMIDSGTTLAYLAEAAYTPFLNAINNAISESVHPMGSKGNPCYMINSSVHRSFPKVSLNFKGGTSMILDPQDYLFEQNSDGGVSFWCMGFQKGQSMTILGDLVLKNKAVVYDLARQRIGWVNYN